MSQPVPAAIIVSGSRQGPPLLAHRHEEGGVEGDHDGAARRQASIEVLPCAAHRLQRPTALQVGWQAERCGWAAGGTLRAAGPRARCLCLDSCHDDCQGQWRYRCSAQPACCHARLRVRARGTKHCTSNPPPHRSQTRRWTRPSPAEGGVLVGASAVVLQKAQAMPWCVGCSLVCR